MNELHFFISKAALLRGARPYQSGEVSCMRILPSIGMNTETGEIFLYSHTHQSATPPSTLRDGFLVASLSPFRFLSLVEGGEQQYLDLEEIGVLHGQETVERLKNQDIFKLSLK